MARTLVTCQYCHKQWELGSHHNCQSRFLAFSRRATQIAEVAKLIRGSINNAELLDLISSTLKDMPDAQFETHTTFVDTTFNVVNKSRRRQGMIGPEKYA